MTRAYLPSPVTEIALAVRLGMDERAPERKMGQTTRIAAAMRDGPQPRGRRRSGGEDMSSQAQRAPHPQAAVPPEPMQDAERGDEPDAVGVVFLALAACAVLYVGAMLGMMTRIDQWAWAMGLVR